MKTMTLAGAAFAWLRWVAPLPAISLTLVAEAASPAGQVVAWGARVEPFVPPGTAFKTMSAGGYHNLALTAQGKVMGWGDNGSSRATPDSSITNIAAVAAGYLHNLVLKTDGTIIAWGDNSEGQCAVPAG